MADIDKGLPNTRTKIDIPSEEEMQEEVSVRGDRRITKRTCRNYTRRRWWSYN
jgi:hypothetical protein